MTVSYSLDVSKARFCGFTKLLIRWRGSIYKILWKEFLLFCVAYALISLTYRLLLNPYQKEVFEKVVLFVDKFTDFIPLSFVLGFYVTLVVGRWWNQYVAIPWPDRVCFKIASYVHGSDERSRTIRRTLGRYLLLLQVLTFQMVSTAVKRRFPTPKHLASAGIMTKEELSVFDKISFSYGKFWVPCHWFTALATRAKKEGRIKDSILLEGLINEVLDFRNNCAIMIGYDWISVPLVYTQVVTIATYLYCIALLVGRQYLDPLKDVSRFRVDLYVPLFTLLQFFFYVGWLKVAEQILNPYGEDDDDFELNWCIDRTVNIVYMIVDHLQMKHPKVKPDPFWNEPEIQLPQTRRSISYCKDPQLGSAFKLDFDEPEYLTMDEVFEEDSADNLYKESLRRTNRQNSSFIQRVFTSRFSQRQNSRTDPAARTLSNKEGYTNAAFSMAEEVADDASRKNPSVSSGTTSIRKLVKKISPSSTNKSSVKMRSTRQKSYNVQDTDAGQKPNGTVGDGDSTVSASPARRTKSAPAATASSKEPEKNATPDEDLEDNSEEQIMDELMPPIPEEASRNNSLVSTELLAASQRGERTSRRQIDRVHDLVREASEVIQEISKSVAHQQEGWKDDEGKGYESCCSIDYCKESSEDSDNEDKKNAGKKAFVVVEVLKEDKKLDFL